MAKEVQTSDSMDYTFHEASPSTEKCTLRFKVKTPHDAHVCLSSSDEQDATPIIEIFLGGWDNSKCAIRRDRVKPDRAEAETPDVLNGDESRGFWVSWDAEGKIEVGREGEEAFMSYTEVEPFEITHYGVRTAWGANGDWEIEGANITTVDKAPYQLMPSAQKLCSGGSLVFSVKAAHDAHLALTRGPAIGGTHYEIFIGGWNNQKCGLRKNGTKPDLAVVDTPNTLTSSEFRDFKLSWKGGLITLEDSVGGVILQHQDSESAPITHYGVRTAWGASGEWKLGGGEQQKQPVPSAPAPPAPAETRAAPEFEPAAEKEELNEVENAVEEEDKGEEEEEAKGEDEEEADAAAADGEEEAAEDLAGGADEPGEACWVPATGGELPEGAVVGGSDLDCDLYIARAKHEGELLPGKFVPSHGTCYISWDGAEHAKEEFEILCGCKAIWHQVNEGDTIPENALPGGRTADGETLFVGRVPHENTVTLGKVHPSHGSCYIPFGGAELGFPDFEVLVRE